MVLQSSVLLKVGCCPSCGDGDSDSLMRDDMRAGIAVGIICRVARLRFC